jgi:hypothetical protein
MLAAMGHINILALILSEKLVNLLFAHAESVCLEVWKGNK